MDYSYQDLRFSFSFQHEILDFKVGQDVFITAKGYDCTN